MSIDEVIGAAPGIPQDSEGPIFRTPWEAEAFAMAVVLHDRGLFTWSEWTAALGEEIKRAQATGDPDTGETYYRQFWGQMIHRLGLSHALGEQKRFVVRTDDQHYQADEKVTVTVEAYDANFEPLTQDKLPLHKLEAELIVPRRDGDGAYADARRAGLGGPPRRPTRRRAAHRRRRCALRPAP